MLTPSENHSVRGHVESADREAPKKQYAAPQLVEYGSVAQMTQSGATVSANDGQTHRARRP